MVRKCEPEPDREHDALSSFGPLLAPATFDAIPYMYRTALLDCHRAEIENAARMMGSVYAPEALDEWARLLSSLNLHSSIHISVPVRSHLSNLTGRHGTPLSRTPWIHQFPGTITFERCLEGFLHFQAFISSPSFLSAPSPMFHSSSMSSSGPFTSSSSSMSYCAPCVPFGAPSVTTSTSVGPGGIRTVTTVTTSPSGRSTSTVIYSADGRVISSSTSSSSSSAAYF